MTKYESVAIPIAGGHCYRIRHGDAALSFHNFFRLLQTDDALADCVAELLTADRAAAYFLEFPPLTSATRSGPVEFVLLDAPGLAARPADASDFASHFANQPGDTIVFPNLGGDALLVVPRPLDANASYAHLADFVRTAPPQQVRGFWRHAAAAVERRIGTDPVWLNTEGSGVPWLHLRLDSSPKYYHHRPYVPAP